MSERKQFYERADWPGDPSRELGDPGAFPFTRGVYPTMYRGKLWTMRQYAGFGTPEETNARFRHLLAAGQTGLSVAFDLPTQMGYDSDHPKASGEVGRAGVAISTVDDLGKLLHEIPLDRVSTSMTINATAAILLAMYVVLGEEQGVPAAKLAGTVQNDILKEFIARGTYIYPMEPSLRLVTDVLRFITESRMGFNPISISGYHMREAGATAVQELAFTFANGLEYVRRAVRAGIAVGELAPRLSFFFAGLHRPVRRGRQVPGGAAAVGAPDEGGVPGGRRGVPAAVSRPDRRLDTHGAAAPEQRGARRDPGACGGAGRHAVAPHQRVR